MFMKNWKKEIFSIPNLLSMFRIGLIPVYIYLYVNAEEPADYYVAGGILAVSCLTDMVDGFIARHFHMITTVGKLLDPLADKFTQLALTLCLSSRYPVLQPVLVLFLIKEFFQLFAAIALFRKGKALDGAIPAGKICTTILFISMIAMVLFPELNSNVIKIIALIDGVALSVAFLQYHLAFFGKNAKVQDIEA